MAQKDYIEIDGFKHLKYTHETYTEEEMLERSRDFLSLMKKRKSLRYFSSKPVDKEIIDNVIKTAATAPSGANKQPWTFCVVSSAEVKKEIRIAAEEEEKKSYDSRMSDRWLKDLLPLGTNWEKPFLETAPYLIIVFKKNYDTDTEGERIHTYYVNESVGLACGFLISAIHNAGLVTLTHTPTPMKFLTKILNRPKNEVPFLLLPVGYQTEEAYVPDIHKKPFNEVVEYY
ncbi:MAG: nitroreductase family protein [Flavobacteriales bacterium]